MQIPFTQYLRPNGRQVQITTECPPHNEDKVIVLLDSGAKFEIEMLHTGLVSMTVEFEMPDGEIETLAHEISKNGPEIEESINRLIISAYHTYRDIEKSLLE